MVRLTVVGLVTVLALAVVSPPGVGAADLVEPWDPGFTDIELYGTAAEGGSSQWVTVAGFGAGHGLSLGLSFVDEGSGSRSAGAIVMLTRRVRDSDLDIWLEAGWDVSAREVELGSVSWAGGGELSTDRGAWVPYARMTCSVDGGTARVHPLLGGMMPFFGGRLELHVELSTEEPDAGAWPIHLAVGPNVHLSAAVELLPELSLVHDRARGENSWALTLGVIVDPSRLHRS